MELTKLPIDHTAVKVSTERGQYEEVAYLAKTRDYVRYLQGSQTLQHIRL
jgi:hypothetical protein